MTNTVHPNEGGARWEREVEVGAGAATTSCALVLLAAGCSGDDDDGSDDLGDLSMLGTWTGHRERMASTEGYREGTATLVVTEQQGLTFVGTMTWSTPEGDIEEPLVAAFTPEGELMAGADDEGTYVFELVDDDTLDYCYHESGEGFRTTCARLDKQDD